MTAADQVEVVYAQPQRQLVISLNAKSGELARELLERSGILNQVPSLREEKLRLGIFGRLISEDHPVSAGDRLEIYRPLVADPKEARRRRALDR